MRNSETNGLPHVMQKCKHFTQKIVRRSWLRGLQGQYRIGTVLHGDQNRAISIEIPKYGRKNFEFSKEKLSCLHQSGSGHE